MRYPACLAVISSLAFLSVGWARSPNVVIVFTDDQGSVDMGCYGAADLETPNMDALAERGVRFTQFLAAAPVCSPSRAGLLTGRYPRRAGLDSNASSTAGGHGMPGAQVTIAEHFKAAGYATAQVGKWHLGYTPEEMPNAQGFDFSFGHMGGCIDNYSHFFYWQGPNRHDLHRNGVEVFHDGEFFQDLMVSEAEGFIEAHRDTPFLLYFAMNAPHYPYQGHAKWLEHYKKLPYPRNLYAAFLSTQDETIGRLLAVLDRLKLWDDTIVVLQSDHGHSTEERAHFGGGSAGPFRGAKFSLFEGGLRVPAILSWAGHLPANETRDQLAHGCDWLPTLAELAGVPLLEGGIDGKSLVPVLKSADAPGPHEVVQWMTGAQWAVREGDWKLIGNPSDTSYPKLEGADAPGKLFLSNLADDPGERKNHAAAEPERVERLKALHETWLKSL
jgi:arylsulfatase A